MQDRVEKSPRAVVVWLACVAFLVAGMVVLGGLVRVTGSGLSIVEWNLVRGILPPLTATAWEELFAAYRQTPEYRTYNSWMELADFRTIFWWEWAHRIGGRVVGAAYAIPLVIFVGCGMIGRQWYVRLAVLFFLGAAQGGVGWWMVRSGLADNPQVSPYRLAIHLSLAFLLLGLLLDTSLRVRKGTKRASQRIPLADLLVGLVLLQVAVGALVAGNKAGLIFNDWPLMSGRFFPPPTLQLDPVWRMLFEDPGWIQFTHRTLGYLVLAAALWLVRQTNSKWAWALCALILTQVVLGIATLLTGVPPGLAVLHQFGSVCVVSLAVVVRMRLQGTPRKPPPGNQAT